MKRFVSTYLSFKRSPFLLALLYIALILAVIVIVPFKFEILRIVLLLVLIILYSLGSQAINEKIQKR